MKFKVLIVDDEYYICENIKSKIEMLQLDEISEIRTCNSGEEAVELCGFYKPQIIITDIEMSGLNGIELIRRLKKVLYPVCFTVLSGYDDYEYVRGAFKEGAMDYLLKPVLTEQLSRILQQQCRQLKDELTWQQESRKELVAVSGEIFSRIAEPAAEETEVGLKQEIFRMLPYVHSRVLVIAFKDRVKKYDRDTIVNAIYDYVEKREYLYCLCASLSERKIGLLLNMEQVDEEKTETTAQELMEAINDYHIGKAAIGVSTAGRLDGLYQLYYEGENSLCDRLIEGYGKIFLWKEERKYQETSEIPGKLKKGTLNLIYNPSLISHTNVWKEIEQGIHSLKILELKRYYNFLTGLINSEIACKSFEKRIEFPAFYEFASYEELIKILNDKIYEYMDIVSETESPVDIIDSIREYIDKNYMENLTLSEIAEQFHISYSHLSKTFHETYGVSFQKYLISKRMSYAEKLLQSQNLGLQEIADAVGYHNVFNFSRAFKKYFGVSPIYYRRQ